jgi:hypothetical protein
MSAACASMAASKTIGKTTSRLWRKQFMEQDYTIYRAFGYNCFEPRSNFGLSCLQK